MKKPLTQETKALRITAVLVFVGMVGIIWWNSQTIDISGELTLRRRIEFNNQKLKAMKFQCRCQNKTGVITFGD